MAIDHQHHAHNHEHDHDHAHDHGEQRLEFTDPAQQSLNAALRSGFNVLRLVMIVLLAAYFASGWFQVDTGQQGLIVRFGRLVQNENRSSPLFGTYIFEPGSHVSLPEPFDQKIRLTGEVLRLQIDTFVFQREDSKSSPRSLAEIVTPKDKLTPGVDGAMISGDRNLSHGLWTIDYRIEAGDRFVLNAAESPAGFEPLLRRLAETAIVRTVAGKRVEQVTREAIGEVADEVRRRLNAELDRLQTGVRVDKVAADTVEPGAVRQAFLEVSAAENDRSRLLSEAEQTATETLNRAAGPAYAALRDRIEEYGAAQIAGRGDADLEKMRAQIETELEKAGGEVATLLRDAEAKANTYRDTLQREVEQFQYIAELYHKQPAATLTRIWLGVRESILTGKKNEVFLVPPVGEIEILVNRDPERKLREEVEEATRRRMGAPPAGRQ
ncbi:MAG: SPFH domain-containing protein [Phycisphaerae bacterium]